jgi:hypothetical protein
MICPRTDQCRGLPGQIFFKNKTFRAEEDLGPSRNYGKLRQECNKL